MNTSIIHQLVSITRDIASLYLILGGITTTVESNIDDIKIKKSIYDNVNKIKAYDEKKKSEIAAELKTEFYDKYSYYNLKIFGLDKVPIWKFIIVGFFWIFFSFYCNLENIHWIPNVLLISIYIIFSIILLLCFTLLLWKIHYYEVFRSFPTKKVLEKLQKDHQRDILFGNSDDNEFFENE